MEQILHDSTDSSYAGHLGTHKAVGGVLEYLEWASSWADAETHIKNCQIVRSTRAAVQI